MNVEPQYRYATVGQAPEFTDIIGLAALPEFAPTAILPGNWEYETPQVYVHANPACMGHYARGHYPALEWEVGCSHVLNPCRPYKPGELL